LYWDPTGNANALASFQCVSLATDAELQAALAAGVRFTRPGELVVPTPVNNGFATRRVEGITLNSAYNGTSVLVQIAGDAEVMVAGPVAEGAIVVPALAQVRSSIQTPLTSFPEMLIVNNPLMTVSYNLRLIDDTTITPNSNNPNQQLWPVGYALKPATAQYQVIPVRLDTGVKWY
jgi:hypothetical protein